jgi:hypothetical protein
MPLMKIRYEGTSGKMHGLKKDSIPVEKATMLVKSIKEMRPVKIIEAIIFVFL